MIIDLELDTEQLAKCRALGQHMATLAADPEYQEHGWRAPGRTCVNDLEHVNKKPWSDVLSIVMANSDIRELLAALKCENFCGCGGDFVEAGAGDEGFAGERNPCDWHQDTKFYLQWFAVSILTEEVAADQAPMEIKSWGKPDSDVVSKCACKPGLCLIRDTHATHRGTANRTARSRPLPTFRLVSGASKKPTCMTMAALLRHCAQHLL